MARPSSSRNRQSGNRDFKAPSGGGGGGGGKPPRRVKAAAEDRFYDGDRKAQRKADAAAQKHPGRQDKKGRTGSKPGPPPGGWPERMPRLEKPTAPKSGGRKGGTRREFPARATPSRELVAAPYESPRERKRERRPQRTDDAAFLARSERGVQGAARPASPTRGGRAKTSQSFEAKPARGPRNRQSEFSGESTQHRERAEPTQRPGRKAERTPKRSQAPSIPPSEYWSPGERAAKQRGKSRGRTEQAPEVSLHEQVLTLLRTPGYRPMDKVALSKALRVSADDRRSLRAVLSELEDAGKILRLRQNRYALPTVAPGVVGRLQVHRNGSAHLLANERGGDEIYIAPHQMGTAMHGDKVAVQKTSQKRRGGGGRLEGRVVEVLERATETIVGLLQRAGKNEPLTVRPDDARIGRDILVRPGGAKLERIPRVGEKVVVKLDRWDDARKAPEGEIIEVLGGAHEKGVDMLSIIRKYNLPVEFPAAVLNEADSIAERVSEEEIAQRHDLRNKFIITIDPDDARDFDDAIDVEPVFTTGGELTGWNLGVHIADVSHYVRPGTALDTEAEKRGNSTYLADRVLPMLPERLSNGICSLKPGVERLVFSAFISFDARGKMKGATFGRSIIKSAARLSYRQAFAIVQGKSEMPPLSAAMEKETRGQATVAEGTPVPVDPKVAEAVRTAWELASLLRKNRFANGSLDLDFPEVKVWLDAEGKAVRLEKMENDASHQLIEECMLAANEAVAFEIKKRQVPTVYRVHEDPDPDRLEEFRELARNYGLKAGDLSVRREVQKVLSAMRNLPEEYALKLQFLKSLKRAAYGTEPLGHYGLAKENYTHFTSPIRRYADLVVHRSLERVLANTVSEPRGEKGQRPRRPAAKLISQGDLGSVAEHISNTERNSSDAERDSTMLKKTEFFQRQLELKEPDAFHAIVVDVKPFGLIVELPDVLITGVVPVNALDDDYYQFEPMRRQFRGRRSKQTYGLGTKLDVIVARVDAYKRQLDFSPA